MSAKLPTIAIVGRPNVGKSTLFNRLIGHRAAIVHDTAGVTRDRHYERSDRYDRPFMVVDTGGIELSDADDLFRVVRKQAMAAVASADVVLLVVDGRSGLTALDREVAQVLRSAHQQVLLVVNKVESSRLIDEAAEFHELGMSEMHIISAEHDRYVSELVWRIFELLGPEQGEPEEPELEPDYEEDDLDASKSLEDSEEDDLDASKSLDDSEEDDWDASESLDDSEEDDLDASESLEDSEEDDLDESEPLDDSEEDDLDESEPLDDESEAPARPRQRNSPSPFEPETSAGPEEIRVAILGRPNAGKSTLVNRLLGEERQVVSDKPGTTMDAIDLPMEFQGQRIVIVDTAGVRRKARVEGELEGFAVSRSIHAIERCHISLMVLDGSEGVTDQDARLIDLVIERGRGLIILVNKWDKVREDPERNVRVVEDELAQRLPHARWAPVSYIAALTGKGCHRILPLVLDVYKELDKRLSTSECNRFLAACIAAHSVPQRYSHPVRINFMTQVRVRPPTFALFSNTPDGVDEGWKRFMSNRLREAYGFQGAPIRLLVRKKRKPGEAREED